MRLPLALTRNFSLHLYGLKPPQRLQLMKGRGAIAGAIVQRTRKVEDMPVGPSRREVRQAGNVRDALHGHGVAKDCVVWKSSVGAIALDGGSAMPNRSRTAA
ncbi:MULTISPECIES: hypothetical protein [unclassified Mesorhizobium]|uniref:hypothetical protein n=1 Tax=unclassified Mesorhizobium TaxID=325217 RepID=UPI001FE0D992|nr:MULTISPECIES: hypothetical protein [unclassified Mesorhizobium]